MKKTIYYLLIILFASLTVCPYFLDLTHIATDTTFHVANINDIVESILLRQSIS